MIRWRLPDPLLSYFLPEIRAQARSQRRAQQRRCEEKRLHRWCIGKAAGHLWRRARSRPSRSRPMLTAFVAVAAGDLASPTCGSRRWLMKNRFMPIPKLGLPYPAMSCRESWPVRALPLL